MADEALPSPLRILVAVMHRKWLAEDFEGAVALAKIAAPYLHPRASAQGGRAAAELAAIEDDRLNELCGAGSDGEGAEAADP